MKLHSNTGSASRELIEVARWLYDIVPPEYRPELCDRVPACRVIDTARQLRTPISPAHLVARLDCSRSTAFRLVAILEELGESVRRHAPAARRGISP
ncbi:MarR family transcriptional regulator [Luteimonas sp. FCS-9]|uniref:MarR family transcriptional regulator n=1 Tax=Luteimonas sp. FCS-9 TaxID=1547516 RepID=UPI00063EB482|nr:MarR family transcriptional regulator [Luteimonas sp. FCS-9]KLJ02842.1 hypothetical protein WQ56_00740 [Luteimonas sp. FCS-9]